jgi:hypothetical protein
LYIKGGEKMYDNDHPVFEKPGDLNVKLWRYMDFTKFVSILANETLFFTRSDKFRDKYDGELATFNKREGISVYKNAYKDHDISEEIIQRLTLNSVIFNKELRKSTTINCWHMNEYESAAMWDLYVKSNDGIAIQTTFNRLSESFNKTDKIIYIGKVKYIDFDKEWIPEGNAYYPFVHKRKSFEHENEVRAIYSEFPNSEIPSPFEIGVNIPVDLDILIEKIYVSPDSPKWLYELVDKIIKKFGINKPVIHSDLYSLPI